MNSTKKFEKDIHQKLKEFDNRIKTSFILIRQDLTEMQDTISAMRKYLKKKDRQYNYAKKEDNKLREEFRKDVDDFTQQISQLKLALDSVRELKKEVVVRKDLAQIEDRVKTSFREDIEEYEQQIYDFKTTQKELEKRIDALENGYVREKKKAWIFKKKEQD